MTTKTLPVPFRGDTILTAKHQDQVYIALKPMVEALGLDWRSQRAKIKSSERWGDITLPLQTAGGVQDMLCIPMRKLNGWLFSINPSKVREDLREEVIAYQEECFQVLHDYWTFGIAVNPRLSTIADRKSLDNAVKRFVSAANSRHRNLSFSEAWSLVHVHMGVTDVADLTIEQLPQALAYVERLLEGELLPREAPLDTHEEVCRRWIQKLIHFPLETGEPLTNQYGVKRYDYDQYSRLRHQRGNPVREIIRILESLGCDIQGAERAEQWGDALLSHYWTALTEYSLLMHHNGANGAINPSHLR